MSVMTVEADISWRLGSRVFTPAPQITASRVTGVLGGVRGGLQMVEFEKTVEFPPGPRPAEVHRGMHHRKVYSLRLGRRQEKGISRGLINMRSLVDNNDS